MNDICILGTGRVAMALATQLAKSGRRFHVGSRDGSAAATKWAGPTPTFLDPATAIDAADIIFNATPGESSVAFLEALKQPLKGKILVDVSNALSRDSKGMPTGLLYPDGSVGEKLQTALPDTFVVKTLNTMLFTAIANPSVLSAMPNVFLSGNDTPSKDKVRSILHDFGWPDALIEDLGGISTARGPESFMHFVPSIIKNHGFAPFALTIMR